ncbi:MAG: hypothetical protein HKO65_19675 [Gemmatimonadetes bacterium]|nr:hypothetical protein [Gemmatimonadota bacterium]
MKVKASVLGKIRWGPSGLGLSMAVFALVLGACSSGAPEMPAPRPIVIRSGERVFAERDRLEEVDAWFRAQQDNITNDPSFMIQTAGRDTPSYPWESLVLVEPDTAKIGIQQGFSDAAQVFSIYAHYRLMVKMGRIGEFLPGGENLDGYPLERAIVARVADAWLLGRAVYQAVPFDPLEELVYANENGFLDALLLTARGEEFKEERQAWLREDPEALERYREWFLATFNREPPGLR